MSMNSSQELKVIDVLVQRFAILIKASEAAFFLVRETPGEIVITATHHFRPGEEDATTIEMANNAFQHYLKKCLETRSDAAIPVGSFAELGIRYCLISLVGDRNLANIYGAAAYISFCESEKHAQQRLSILRGILHDKNPI